MIADLCSAHAERDALALAGSVVGLIASLGLRAERLREKMRKEHGRDPAEVSGFTYDDGQFDALVEFEADLRRHHARVSEALDSALGKP